MERIGEVYSMTRGKVLISHHPQRLEDESQMPWPAGLAKACEEASDCKYCSEHDVDGVDNGVIGED
jgi:hypothetical protein